MNDTIVWIIIIAFYAPLHFMLPVLFLFIVGDETEFDRKRLIRSALIDAVLSMVLAFTIAIILASYEQILLAMITLVLFMTVPFIRIIINRRML